MRQHLAQLLFFCSFLCQTISLGIGRKDRCLNLARMTSCFHGALKKLEHVSEEDSGLMGISREVAAIRQVCRQIEDGKKCVAFRMSRCGISQQNEERLNYYATHIVRHGIVHICQTPGLLADYSLHAPCLYKHQMAAYECLQNSLRGFTNVTAKDFSTDRDIMDTYCRAVERVFDCGLERLGPSCGNDTVLLFNKVVNLFLPEYISMKCQSLRQGSVTATSNEVYIGARQSTSVILLPVLLVLQQGNRFA